MNKKIVDKLLKDYQTPFYVFDIEALKDRINYLKRMMPDNVTLCYAMKANPFLVKEISDVIEKYEVCSFGEYKICEELNVDKSKLVISGVYKDEDGICEMIEGKDEIGVYTVESVHQFELLNNLSLANKKRINIILRLTSGNQFGITEEEIENIIVNKDNYQYLNILGIQYFSGTQKNLVKRIEKEVMYLDGYIKHLKNDLNFNIAELEFGTGFPVNYFEGTTFDEETYLTEVADLLKNMEYQGHITMELGRSIAASCGSYFTKVVDTKTNKEGNFAILDGGMNHLVYYGQMMAMKKPMLEILPARTEENIQEWNLCGALCTINDLIVKKTPISNLQIGDVFMFKNTGAYSMTEGIALFLSRDLPKVIFLNGEDIKVVREDINTYKLNMPNFEGREN